MKSWSINRIWALVLGIVFTILGVVGFLTPPENSTGVQAILGLFDGDTFHNIFFLITGLIGLGVAFWGEYFRRYNQVVGIVYTLIGLLALIPSLYYPSGSYGTDNGLFLNLTHMNAGDIILNLVAGVISLVIGFALAGEAAHPHRARVAR
ncbi:DUF4383 domain-containing protein [Tengunoibacter tsumagoiensis]|uniref:DUF4383 domain-containing protein n=1 Tax=Tengunoibacter tsumagoiensis TaxID=2014871 RepID=A0A402A5B3_9CHLR|nr:DUF4383 domain-containing protein [Tengunoibacter tsumagoiensis]GCE14343.1 hypothetical protein KTT_42020 [Tengunoibacter tsumagoiensis]